MQREQSNNSEENTGLNPGRNINSTEEATSIENDTDGIFETPLSRMDGETLFGNVSDTYIAPGGEEDDDDDDLEDDDDIDEVAIGEKEDVAEKDPDAEDLNDDDLLLDDDDEDEEDDDL